MQWCLQFSHYATMSKFRRNRLDEKIIFFSFYSATFHINTGGFPSMCCSSRIYYQLGCFCIIVQNKPHLPSISNIKKMYNYKTISYMTG